MIILIWGSSTPLTGVHGMGMGPLIVLVSPCLRENEVVTCKIGSFLCSLDNLLQKNVIVFFLKIKFQNSTHLKKMATFDLLFTYFSYQRNVSKLSTTDMYLHKCQINT